MNYPTSWQASHKLPHSVGGLSRTTPLCGRPPTNYPTNWWEACEDLPYLHFVGGLPRTTPLRGRPPRNYPTPWEAFHKLPHCEAHTQ